MIKKTECISKWASTKVTRLTVIANDGDGKIQVDLLEDHEEYGKTAFIWDLFVKPECRRKGLAKELMNYALQRARDFGYNTATLEWAKTDSTLETLAWYSRLGFTETEFSNTYSLMVKQHL